MAVSSSSLSVLSPNSVPRISPKQSEINARLSNPQDSASVHVKLFGKSSRRSGSVTKLSAGGKLALIEPDLNEDPKDRWATNGVDPEDFLYGEYDGAHTYHEGGVVTGSFWGAIADDIKAVECPTGFQGFIGWLFLPAVATAMYFNVPGEYLFIGAAVFVTIFTVIELDKPDKPHNFEPEIYNMERGARDKLINDYNTMSIWEFNEKYGHLWDFTVQRDMN
ncbi:hypothetical protein AB3S75_046716 [Citrus x aurantiifolia]